MICLIRVHPDPYVHIQRKLCCPAKHNALYCCAYREDSRISTAFITALNSFLLRNGLDVSSRSSELQQALQPFVLRAWRSIRDHKLKDAFITCLSIQVKLGGLQVSMLIQ